jgi:hypothetical protein
MRKENFEEDPDRIRGKDFCVDVYREAWEM